MLSIRGFLKNLIKKLLGDKISAYLYKQILRAFALRPSHVKDLLVLRYRFIRPGISKQIRMKVSSRTKPHALILSEKWCMHNPEFGPSADYHMFFGSLEASGLATYDRLNHDEYCQNHRSFDTGVLLECIRHKPDLVVIINLLISPVKFKTLETIKEKLQIPVVVIWGDSVRYMEEAEAVLPFVDLSIPLDSTTAYLQKTHQAEKYLPLWAPMDPRVFYNPGMRRDIDVSFVGTMSDHPDRLAGISALRLNGIDVYQAGGQREKRLSVEEYARTHMRSKISLNFCYHPNLMPQYKGRIFEATLCGAMLLEAENAETAKWFEPMVDYVPFKDEADLVEKVKYYLAHDSERTEIAARGHQKAKELYTGERFWETVLERVLGTDF